MWDKQHLVNLVSSKFWGALMVAASSTLGFCSQPPSSGLFSVLLPTDSSFLILMLLITWLCSIHLDLLAIFHCSHAIPPLPCVLIQISEEVSLIDPVYHLEQSHTCLWPGTGVMVYSAGAERACESQYDLRKHSYLISRACGWGSDP